MPGGHGHIANICKTFNNGTRKDLCILTFKGELPDFGADEIGLEEVSGVFKKYLRELPEPLLKDDSPDGELQAKFSAVLNGMLSNFHSVLTFKVSEEVDQVAELKRLIPQLTEYRRALCKEIFFVLHLVSRESDINLMDAMNLATIFGKLFFCLAT